MASRLKWVSGMLILIVVILYSGSRFLQQDARSMLVSTVDEIRSNGRCKPAGDRLCGFDELRLAFGSSTRRFCYQYLNHALLFVGTSCLHNVELKVSGIDLKSIDLTSINLNNADFSKSDLSKANLSNSSIRSSNFSYANLNEANMKALKGLSLMDHASFRNADLQGATSTFIASFKEADFTGADLRHVNFGRSDFLGADFSQADLRNANLSASRLSGATFSEARIENLVLHQVSGIDDETLVKLKTGGAIVDREGLEAALNKGLKIPVMWWFNLSKMTLSGVDFTDITLSGVTFVGAKLDGAKFVNASLDQANFRDADLRGADFSDSYLIHADFRGADLRGARFDGAVRLETIKLE